MPWEVIASILSAPAKVLVLSFAILLVGCDSDTSSLLEDADASQIENRSIVANANAPADSHFIEGGEDYSFYTDEVFPAREKLATAISCLPSAKQSDLFSCFKRLATTYAEGGHYEFEFFFFKHKNEPQVELDGLSIEAVLVNNDESTKSTIDWLCANDPALTILLINERSTDEFNEKIFVDNEIDDQNPNAKVFYSENCTSGLHPISIEPTKPSFVIREAECSLRPADVLHNNSMPHPMPTKQVQLGASGCVASIPAYDYITPPDGGGDGPGPGGDGPGPGGSDDDCTEDCDRDCIDCKENMRRFRTTKDFDGWLKGKGEWNWYVIYAEGVDYSVDDSGDVQVDGESLTYVVKRSEGVREDNQWRYENFDIIRWDLDRPDSDRMKYVLYEDDNGRRRDVTVPLKFKFTAVISGVEVPIEFETEVSWRITAGDDFIGETIVDYCDNIGFQYHPNSHVDFDCNERCI